jgi:hypothetical protein
MNEMKDILLPGEPAEVSPELPADERLLFAPVDKHAFGVAIGAVCSAGVLALTAAELIWHREPSLDLVLLAQYFAGYTVSWTGALIGALWAFGLGFCAGWFTAFVRNLALAISLFLLRSRAELTSARDFLDHI